MIKENVLRKNLLTNEIDYGNVDTEFENENLKGNIIEDNPWVEISEEDSAWKSQLLNTTKIQKLKEVKAEAAKRIEASYPQYKQVNYGSAVMEILNKENYAVKQGIIYTLTDNDKISLNKAKVCKDFISLIRSKSDTLEILINSKSTIETLNGIDIYDDYHWISK